MIKEEQVTSGMWQ